MSGDLSKAFEWNGPFDMSHDAKAEAASVAVWSQRCQERLNGILFQTGAQRALERARAEIDADIARAKAGSSDEIFGLATARETITRLLESRP